MREYLVRDHDFVDVETPTLFRRTPGVRIGCCGTVPVCCTVSSRGLGQTVFVALYSPLCTLSVVAVSDRQTVFVGLYSLLCTLSEVAVSDRQTVFVGLYSPLCTLSVVAVSDRVCLWDYTARSVHCQ